MKNGECRLLERPTYAIYGKTQYDQDWIDGSIEAAIGGCGWQRPLPRPPEFDTPGKALDITPTLPKKKVGVIQRVKAAFTRKPAPFPTTAPRALAPAAPTEVEAPPDVKVDPVLEFLGRRS